MLNRKAIQMPLIFTGWDKSTHTRLGNLAESYRITTIHDGSYRNDAGLNLGPGSMLFLAPGRAGTGGLPRGRRSRRWFLS